MTSPTKVKDESGWWWERRWWQLVPAVQMICSRVRLSTAPEPALQVQIDGQIFDRMAGQMLDALGRYQEAEYRPSHVWRSSALDQRRRLVRACWNSTIRNCRECSMVSDGKLCTARAAESVLAGPASG